MIVKMGFSITFVQSSLPPRPVSKISRSAGIEAKAKKALKEDKSMIGWLGKMTIEYSLKVTITD